MKALSRINLYRQLGNVRLVLLAAAGLALGGIGAVLFLHFLRGIPSGILTRDLFVVADVPVYFGLLSTLGLLVWAAAAAVWLVSWLLLWRFEPRHRIKTLALASLLFTTLLLLDDAFMLHEDLLPRVLRVPESLVLGGYVALALAYLIFGSRRIFQTWFLPCLLAGAFLGASFSIDALFASSALSILVEDCLKFAGIVFWLAYAISTATQVVGELVGKE